MCEALFIKMPYVRRMIRYVRASRAITLTLSRECRVMCDRREYCTDLHNVRGKDGREIPRERVNIPMRREINIIYLALENRKRSINVRFNIFKLLSSKHPASQTLLLISVQFANSLSVRQCHMVFRRQVETAVRCLVSKQL